MDMHTQCRHLPEQRVSYAPWPDYLDAAPTFSRLSTPQDLPMTTVAKDDKHPAARVRNLKVKQHQLLVCRHDDAEIQLMRLSENGQFGLV